MLQAQLDEYRAAEKKRRVSQQFTPNNKSSIMQLQNENSKLKEELEIYKELCQSPERTVSILILKTF